MQLLIHIDDKSPDWSWSAAEIAEAVNLRDLGTGTGSVRSTAAAAAVQPSKPSVSAPGAVGRAEEAAARAVPRIAVAAGGAGKRKREQAPLVTVADTGLPELGKKRPAVARTQRSHHMPGKTPDSPAVKWTPAPAVPPHALDTLAPVTAPQPKNTGTPTPTDTSHVPSCAPKATGSAGIPPPVGGATGTVTAMELDALDQAEADAESDAGGTPAARGSAAAVASKADFMARFKPVPAVANAVANAVAARSSAAASTRGVVLNRTPSPDVWDIGEGRLGVGNATDVKTARGTAVLTLDAALALFGHKDFKSEQQRQAVAAVRAGRDALVFLPTGGGKSLCYQLPAVMLEGVTLVVSPLLALIEDQINHLRARNIRCEALNSATGAKEGSRIFGDLNMKRPMTKLLYLTPEKIATANGRRLLKQLHQRKMLVFHTWS